MNVLTDAGRMNSSTEPSTIKHPRATQTLIAGLVLGIAADFLLWDNELPGPGLTVWLTLAAITALTLNHRAAMRWRLTLAAWSFTAVAASLMLILRASEVFIPLMLLVMLLALGMTMLQAGGVPLSQVRLDGLAKMIGLSLPRIGRNSWELAGQVELRQYAPGFRTRGMVRGLLLAVPLVLIFVLLFSSADAAFNRYAASVGEWLSLSIPRHLLVIAIFSWLSAGFMAASFFHPGMDIQKSFLPDWRLGREETAVVMGALVLLFLSFVVLQASYFFGGRETIEATSGLTLAEYARRGFFELVVVSALTLSLLLIMSGRSEWRLFQPLAFMLIFCVLIILASAVQRLHLYTEQFGLTLARVIAVAFMLWLAGTLIAFALTVLRGRQDGFIAGMIISGIALLLLLALFNPAAAVARTNIDRSVQSGAEVDGNYLAQLGADAVPEVLNRFDILPPLTQCQVAMQLRNRWGDSARDVNWRDWNAARQKAVLLVASQRNQLEMALPLCAM